MRYPDFERRLIELSAAATDSSRRNFAIDTIARLHSTASIPLESELTSDERNLARRIAVSFTECAPEVLQQSLNSLNDSMTADDVRAIEFHPSITEWMSAIEHWIRYQQSGDSTVIARLAINMVNNIDYAIENESDDYSIDNMLSSPVMRAEYERQQRLLVSRTEQN